MKAALHVSILVAVTVTACQGILGIEEGSLLNESEGGPGSGGGRGSGGGTASGGKSGSGGEAPSSGGASSGGNGSGGDGESGGAPSSGGVPVDPLDSGADGSDGALASGGAGGKGGSGGGASGGTSGSGGTGSGGACGFTMCGNVCANRDTNANHCGVCSHSCFGGTCTGGKCQPRAIVTGQTGTTQIATNASGIYWLISGTVGSIHKAALDGSGVTPLATSQSYTTDIAADATTVYWLAGGSVYRVPIGGGVPNQLGDIASVKIGLAVDSSGAYYNCSTSICKAPLDNSGRFALESDVVASDVAVEAGIVYWLDTTRKVVEKHPNAAGPFTTIGTGLTTPRQLAVYQGTVYFTDAARVRRIASGVPGISDVTTGTAPDAIAVDASGLYWVDGTTINRWTGTGVTPIATDAGTLGGIALTADSVYWANTTNGRIMRLAKPL